MSYATRSTDEKRERPKLTSIKLLKVIAQSYCRALRCLPLPSVVSHCNASHALAVTLNEVLPGRFHRNATYLKIASLEVKSSGYNLAGNLRATWPQQGSLPMQTYRHFEITSTVQLETIRKLLFRKPPFQRSPVAAPKMQRHRFQYCHSNLFQPIVRQASRRQKRRSHPAAEMR